METYERYVRLPCRVGRGLRSQLRFDLHKVGVFQPGPIRSSAKSLAVGTEGALEAGGKKLPTPISVNYLNSRFDVML